jgi:hypothetical protein
MMSTNSFLAPTSEAEQQLEFAYGQHSNPAASTENP